MLTAAIFHMTLQLFRTNTNRDKVFKNATYLTKKTYQSKNKLYKRINNRPSLKYSRLLKTWDFFNLDGCSRLSHKFCWSCILSYGLDSIWEWPLGYTAIFFVSYAKVFKKSDLLYWHFNRTAYFTLSQFTLECLFWSNRIDWGIHFGLPRDWRYFAMKTTMDQLRQALQKL